MRSGKPVDAAHLREHFVSETTTREKIIMAMEMWKASKEVQDKVQALIGQHHPDLALVSSGIVVVFREKAANSGGQTVLGRPMRSNNRLNALADADYEFILEIGADVWEGMNSLKREALLDHLLCGCRCEEADSDEEENLKCSIARPDIQAYSDNVSRYGMWFPTDGSEEDGLGPGEKTPAEVVQEAVTGEEVDTTAKPLPIVVTRKQGKDAAKSAAQAADAK